MAQFSAYSHRKPLRFEHRTDENDKRLTSQRDQVWHPAKAEVTDPSI
jgi:hypothetical protein